MHLKHFSIQQKRTFPFLSLINSFFFFINLFRIGRRMARAAVPVHEDDKEEERTPRKFCDGGGV